LISPLNAQRASGRSLQALVAACLFATAAAAAATTSSVFLEELTWTEVDAAIRGGTTTILIPIGGTEQNGTHMVLGKHNTRAHILAGKIAGELGNAIVAPVVAYTPEGRIDPPAGHMRYAGTISISDESFMAMLETAAASFRQHGFTDIVFLGDSGNYQPQLKAVAERLNRKWSKTRFRAHWIEAYYRATQATYIESLRAKGMSPAEIGTHAGAADTSLALALDPTLVRSERLATSAPDQWGVHGDPRRSTTTLGQAGVDAIVAQSVAAIRKSIAARH
jgi:creatinine amidohydrolase/Fe(II)-dependent formamide hydrolase-like protein